MAIHFSCPHCGNETQVSPEYVGQTGPCAACGQEITVPGPGGAVPPMANKSNSTTMITCLILAVIGVPIIIAVVGILIALLLPATQAAREAARRMQCSNNLKLLALSMHNYHDTHKTFPAAAWNDDDGKPKTSWRICILPFLESQSLYDAYDFDQPWDSEHNLQVASRMGTGLYQCPSNRNPEYKEIKGYKIPVSHYVMVTGPNTIGGEGEGTVMREITDGTSNTFMIVEIRGANAPAWTEPVDLTLEELKRGINSQGESGLGSFHPGGMNAALCDGSVHFLSESIDPGTLENLATINDGNPVVIDE